MIRNKEFVKINILFYNLKIKKMATSSKKINYYQQDQILLKILKVIRAL
jgi:hypothetical protein